MKKILSVHFWFGRKNRTYGLTYSCFGFFFFLKKETGKNQGKKKDMIHRNALECLYILLHIYMADVQQGLLCQRVKYRKE